MHVISQNLIERISQQSVEGGSVYQPFFVKIKLLWECNLTCSFCNLPKGIAPMRPEYARSLIDQLAIMGCGKINFSGGEVFLYDGIFELLDHTVKRGIKVNCTSNGTMLNKENVKRLRDSGINSITISLDAATADLHDKIRGVKGTWKRAVKAMGLLEKYGVKSSVNTVAHLSNMHELDALHRLLYSINPKIRWNILPIHGCKESRISGTVASLLSNMADEWILLRHNPFPKNSSDALMYEHGWYAFERLQKRPQCFAPWISLFITPDGYVYSCCKGRTTMLPWGRLTGDTLLEQICTTPIAISQRESMLHGTPDSVCKRCRDFSEINESIESICSIEKQDVFCNDAART
ncbi:MAG: radical SAM protein [Fibrobacterota bacterium]|nr:radical SAM protein [Chitinispirillaceae bacterium]